MQPCLIFAWAMARWRGRLSRCRCARGVGIPFALMTGYTSESLDARFAGCVVLHEPFSDGVAVATIKRLLDGVASGQR